MSHSIVTSDAPGEPHIPSNQEVLEVRDEQVKSVTMVCRCVEEMGRATIGSGLFEDGSPQLSLMERMVFELWNVV